MAKKRKKKQEIKEEKPRMDKRVMYANILRLLILAAVTMLVFGLYRFLINQYYFEYVLIVYMTLAAALIFTYVLYNRGFSRLHVTEDMLPNTMTAEEKREFIEDAERRLKRSRPLLIGIFAFAFTFIFDIIELYALPLLEGLFGK